MRIFWIAVFLVGFSPISALCQDLSGNFDGGLPHCSNFSCCRSCVRFSQLRARCYYPTSNYIKRAIERETEKSLINQFCTRISVRVRLRGTRSNFANNANSENNATINNIGGDPFKVAVTKINSSCQTTIPVEVRVRAHDRFGLRRDESYSSLVKVQGILR